MREGVKKDIFVGMTESPEIQRLERATLLSARYFEESIRNGLLVSASRKADSSLVLNLDLESQAIIREELGSHLPVVAEEDESSHALINTEANYYLVDPLDGTSSCKRFFGERGGQVGFGPLLGLVEGNKLRAAAYYNVPQQMYYFAKRGGGVFCSSFKDGIPNDLPGLKHRERILITHFAPLKESAALFYTGSNGEIPLVEKLRKNGMIENAYRFGGFANDCIRIAHGYEQIQIQFNIKPWDYSAVLFPIEAGYELVADPLNTKATFESWKIRINNPVLIASQHSIRDLLNSLS